MEFHIFLCRIIIEHDFIYEFLVVVNFFIIFANILFIIICLLLMMY